MNTITPTVSYWTPPVHSVPSVASWYVDEYITITVNIAAGIAVGQPAGFGPEAVGWLLAQGWVMTGTGPRTVYDTDWASSHSNGSRTFSDGSHMSYSSSSTTPTGKAASQQASFKRTRINPRVVLAHMISEFTQGYNEGRTLNNNRYNDLVRCYLAMATATQRDAASVDLRDADFTPLVDYVVSALKTRLTLSHTALPAVSAPPSASVPALPTAPALPSLSVPATPTVAASVSGIPAAPALPAGSIALPAAPAAPAASAALPSAPEVSASPALPADPVLPSAPADAAAAISSAADGYGSGAAAEINHRFDELVSKAKADLVSRGLWNSTLYAATLAEIERQRSMALADAGDKAARLKVEALSKGADLRLEAFARLGSLRIDHFARVAGLRLDAWSRYVSLRLDHYAKVSGARLDEYRAVSGARLDHYARVSGARLDEYRSVSGARVEAYARIAGVRLDEYSRLTSAKLELYAKAAGVRLDEYERTSRAKLELYSRVASALLDRYSRSGTLDLDRWHRHQGLALDRAAREEGLKVEVFAKLLAAQSAVADGILKAVDTLVSSRRGQLDPIRLRNDAFKAMFEFMERRTDEYPGLADMAKIVQQVGYANGGTLVAP